MTSKRRGAYNAFFRWLVQETGHLPHLAVVHADYEIGLRESARSVFGDIIQGCLFHHSQAIVRKCKSVGLQNAITRKPLVKRWLRFLISLAFLPSNKIAATFNLVKVVDGVDYAPDEVQKMRSVEHYYFSYWISSVGPDNFSVHGAAHRTTNSIESYHKRLSSKVKVRRGNIWQFLTHLKDIVKASILDAARSDNGLQIRRSRKPMLLSSDKRILDASKEVALNRLTPLEFVRRISHVCDSLIDFSTEIAINENDQVNDVAQPLEQEEPGVADSVESQQDLEERESIPDVAVNIDGPNMQPVCPVCRANRPAIAWSCGHLFCNDCSSVLASNQEPRCGVCREPLQNMLRVFL